MLTSNRGDKNVKNSSNDMRYGMDKPNYDKSKKARQRDRKTKTAT